MLLTLPEAIILAVVICPECPIPPRVLSLVNS